MSSFLGSEKETSVCLLVVTASELWSCLFRTHSCAPLASLTTFKNYFLHTDVSREVRNKTETTAIGAQSRKQRIPELQSRRAEDTLYLTSLTCFGLALTDVSSGTTNCSKGKLNRLLVLQCTEKMWWAFSNNTDKPRKLPVQRLGASIRNSVVSFASVRTRGQGANANPAVQLISKSWHLYRCHPQVQTDSAFSCSHYL